MFYKWNYSLTFILLLESRNCILDTTIVSWKPCSDFCDCRVITNESTYSCLQSAVSCKMFETNIDPSFTVYSILYCYTVKRLFVFILLNELSEKVIAHNKHSLQFWTFLPTSVIDNFNAISRSNIIYINSHYSSKSADFSFLKVRSFCGSYSFRKVHIQRTLISAFISSRI